MKTTKLFTFFTFLIVLSSNFAEASLICRSGSISEGRVASICSDFDILDNSSIETNHNCNGFEVLVNADLYHKPRTLKLTLINEAGEEKSTDSKKKLSWIDENQNGVFIDCVENK
jgi:hypothetical protein